MSRFVPHCMRYEPAGGVRTVQLRPYYTMLCFTRVLDFSRVFNTTMLVSKTQVKTQETREKRKKNVRKLPNGRKTQKMFLYYTIDGLKTRACCIFSCFCSRFCSQTLYQFFQNHLKGSDTLFITKTPNPNA